MQIEKEEIRQLILNWAEQLKKTSISPTSEWKIYKSKSCPDVVFINAQFNLTLGAQAKACVVCEASTHVLNEFIKSNNSNTLLASLEDAINFLEGKINQTDFHFLEILKEFNQGPRTTCMLLPWKSALLFLTRSNA